MPTLAMESTSEENASFYSALCSAIAENVAKIIGGTAYTLVGSLEGVSVSKDLKITVSPDFSKERLDAFVSIYVKIIGPVAKTLAGRACAGIKKHHGTFKVECEKCKESLPAWLYELNNKFAEEEEDTGVA